MDAWQDIVVKVVFRILVGIDALILLVVLCVLGLVLWVVRKQMRNTTRRRRV